MQKRHFSIASVLKTQDCIPWTLAVLDAVTVWAFSNFYLKRDNFTNLMQDLDFCIFQNLASSFGGNEELGDRRWWFSSRDQVLFWYCLHRLCTKPFVGILNRIKGCEGITELVNQTAISTYFQIMFIPEVDCVMRAPLLHLRSCVALSFKVRLSVCQELVSPDQISIVQDIQALYWPSASND